MGQIRLSHVLAQYADATTRMKRVQDKSYHLIQKAGGLIGFTKIYRQTLADTAIQPNQAQLLQTRAYEVAREFIDAQRVLINAIATKDYANTKTNADVVVDGAVALSSAPPTLLLSLEKVFTDLRTFLITLPILPPDEDWRYDEAQDCRVSKHPSESTRVENVKEGLVLWEPPDPGTSKHPAQTTVVENPKVVGMWTTTKFSGCVTRKDAVELQKRAQVILDAIKKALHEANSYVAEEQTPAELLLEYVTAGIL